MAGRIGRKRNRFIDENYKHRKFEHFKTSKLWSIPSPKRFSHWNPLLTSLFSILCILPGQHHSHWFMALLGTSWDTSYYMFLSSIIFFVDILILKEFLTIIFFWNHFIQNKENILWIFLLNVVTIYIPSLYARDPRLRKNLFYTWEQQLFSSAGFISLLSLDGFLPSEYTL